MLPQRVCGFAISRGSLSPNVASMACCAADPEFARFLQSVCRLAPSAWRSHLTPEPPTIYLAEQVGGLRERTTPSVYQPFENEVQNPTNSCWSIARDSRVSYNESPAGYCTLGN